MASTHSCHLWLVLAAACAPAGVEPMPPPPVTATTVAPALPAVVPTSEPPAAPTISAFVTAPPAPNVLPPPPPRAAGGFPGASEEQLLIAESICPAAVRIEPRMKPQVGCRTCVPAGAEASRPDGKIAKNPDPFYPFSKPYRGSFTEAGAEQAALIFGNCLPPPDFADGGMLIVDKAPDEWFWRRISFKTGVMPIDCATLPRKQHDLLVCYDQAHGTADGGLAVGADDFVNDEVITLVDAYYNSPGVCNLEPEGVVKELDMKRLEIVDVDGDGVSDVRVHIYHAAIEVTPRSRRIINALCDAERSYGASYKFVRPEKYMRGKTLKIDFLQQGDTLVPTQAAKAHLKTIGSRDPR